MKRKEKAWVNTRPAVCVLEMSRNSSVAWIKVLQIRPRILRRMIIIKPWMMYKQSD